MAETPPQAGRRDALRFISHWFRRPAAIGAIAPSGRALGAAMAAGIDIDRPGCVLELGGGTGAITRACLDGGVAPADLVVVKREPALCRLIAARFPGVRVICGDAGDLEALARAHGVGPVKAVVSGLPLLSMPAAVRRRIVHAAFAVMMPDAVFLQFTYGPLPPIPGAVAETLRLTGDRADWVLRNLPPASVWRYARAPATN